MSPTDVHYETDGALAIVTLNRPNARNAYSEAMVKEILACMDAAEADRTIRCMILTGAGSAFSAGGDLKRMRDRTGMFEGDTLALRQRYVYHIQQIPRRIARFDLPLIAAINGPAVGAGLDLACMCDMRLAARTAKFGSTFVKMGLVPGDGGAYLLPRIVGLPRALDLMLTGRIIDAETALNIGLVNQVVAPEDLMTEARTYAEGIAENAPLAVQLTKRATYRSLDTDLETALELAATYQGIVQRTQDHEEAVTAFLEKRSPSFRGN